MSKIDLFKKNGFIVLRNIIDKKIINECLKTAKKINPKNFTKNKYVIFDEAKNKKKYLKYFQHIEIFFPEFYKLQNQKILEISKNLFNQNTYFCSMGLHNKAPSQGTSTPFHQDNFFNRKKPPFELTAYIPLEKQDKTNGSIIYVKGSHKKGVLKHVPSNAKAFSATLQDFKSVKKNKIYRTRLNKGDIIFHHTNVIHGAEKNNSKSKTRFAVSVSIVGIKSKIDNKLNKIYQKFLKSNRKLS